jgi:hypothetical protein
MGSIAIMVGKKGIDAPAIVVLIQQFKNYRNRMIWETIAIAAMNLRNQFSINPNPTVLNVFIPKNSPV